jgi:hypothetical protein
VTGKLAQVPAFVSLASAAPTSISSAMPEAEKQFRDALAVEPSSARH